MTDHPSENHLQGQPGDLRMTVTVTRAATGLKETFELVGKCTPDEIEALINRGKTDGSNTQ